MLTNNNGAKHQKPAAQIKHCIPCTEHLPNLHTWLLTQLMSLLQQVLLRLSVIVSSLKCFSAVSPVSHFSAVSTLLFPSDTKSAGILFITGPCTTLDPWVEISRTSNFLFVYDVSHYNPSHHHDPQTLDPFIVCQPLMPPTEPTCFPSYTIQIRTLIQGTEALSTIDRASDIPVYSSKRVEKDYSIFSPTC